MNAAQRAARASKGGQALVLKRGIEHMRKIGRAGAATFYKRYEWQPAGLTQFALVRKSDHAIMAFSDGAPVNRRSQEALR